MTRMSVLSTVAVIVTALYLSLEVARGAEDYSLVGMLPELRQPWYFERPTDVAVDVAGNVYVADSVNRRVQKFSSEGVFIDKWGTYGDGDGEFIWPEGVAVHASGNVYVADTGNHRIQKFTSDGRFIAKWGKEGGGDGEFSAPERVAVDAVGNVYVADSGNHRIQKFTSDGDFITKMGQGGSGDGEFDTPWGVAVDAWGDVYVVDRYNYRIQKFTSEGLFITQWAASHAAGIAVDDSGSVYVAQLYQIQKLSSEGVFIADWGEEGNGEGEFQSPEGVAVDASGNVYVADSDNNTIQKFSSDGSFIAKWGACGTADGEFCCPISVTVDGRGDLYVADYNNDRVQRFSSDGPFIAKWGKAGTGDGEFYGPGAMAVDSFGNVYVADYGNNRIQKFTSDGHFITKWDKEGSGDGEFYAPVAMALDSFGNVYVADYGNNRIQEFTSDGLFITKWGKEGTGDGEFQGPVGVAVDPLGGVYVVDAGNKRIQKFTSDGRFIMKWGSEGWGDDEFQNPAAVAVDGLGNVYVADMTAGRIQKFTSEGVLTTRWGARGSDGAQFWYPMGVAVDPFGNVYVADSGNHRIQKFRSEAVVDIDVPFKAQVPPGDWAATQNCGQACSLMVFSYYWRSAPDVEGIKHINDWLWENYRDPVNDYNGSATTTAKLCSVAIEYASFSGSYAAAGWGLERLKEEISPGNPVIVALVAGLLPNRGYPYAGGHFVVAKGYTPTEIICNDPGTNQGHGKRYQNEDFAAAMQAQGGSVVVVLPSAALTEQQISNRADDLSSVYKVPSVIIKAVMEQESNWRQFDGEGNPLIRYEADEIIGIGLMQVTLKATPTSQTLTLGRVIQGLPEGSNPFTTTTEDVSVDVNRLKADWRYNLEIGVRLLVAKKVASLGAGDDARILENWYYPLAYYNGAVKGGANDPSNGSYQRSVATNDDWKSTNLFPYQECVYNIIAQLYAIPPSRRGHFGPAVKVTLPGPVAVHSGAAQYDYVEATFRFWDCVTFYGDGTCLYCKEGANPENRTNVRVHRVQFGPVGPPVPLVGPSVDAGSGALVLSWQSAGDQRYQVESSDDLLTWSLEKVIETSGDGVTSWQDAGIAARQRRFYRVLPLHE